MSVKGTTTAADKLTWKEFIFLTDKVKENRNDDIILMYMYISAYTGLLYS